MALFNSLFNKLNHVSDFMSDNRVDIMGIAETWLLSSIPDSFVSLDNFNLVRCDVEGLVPKHGVCIYVTKRVDFVRVDVGCPNCVVVHLFDFDVYVCVVYRPPSYSLEENEVLICFLEQFCISREVVILGDFNLPSLRWSAAGGAAVSCGLPALERSFLDCFLRVGFSQWVCEPTFAASGNTLDLTSLE